MPPSAPIDLAAVGLLQRNAWRLSKLVNTLLVEFSRIEAGRVQAVHEPVQHPSRRDEETRELLRELLESRGRER